MKEYDLYFPLHYNDSQPVEPQKLSRIKKLLVEQFGGLTHFPQENEGLWNFAGRTFRDRIVILRVLSDNPEQARAFFARLRETLREELRQADILIVEREVQALE